MSKEDEIAAEARRIEEAADVLQRQAEALRETASVVYDRSLVSDARSLRHMADHIQGRADAARLETERLQGVADRLRDRAREAAQAQGGADGRAQ